MVKLNQKNPAVKNYICDVIRFWVSEFDVDGIRLDAADVLDFEFMQDLRRTANEVKPDFWLMGEVIHGNYGRWVNESTLHSVTNYAMHKAFYSGHNDHNYFEIAHTVKYLSGMCGNNLMLYNFVDNHDVERISSKLTNKANYTPVHVLLYTMPGVPSIYYGSEFGIEGVKGHGTDAPLRPELAFEEYQTKAADNPCVKLISALGHIRQETVELGYGEYKELLLTNRQYAFARNYKGSSVIITVNNDENESTITISAGNCGEYIGAISGVRVPEEAKVQAKVPVKEIMKPEKPAVEMPVAESAKEELAMQAPVASASEPAPIKEAPKTEPAPLPEEKKVEIPVGKSYEEMTIEELQQVILGKMAKNGPVTDQMRKTVYDNTHHGSLITWARSF